MRHPRLPSVAVVVAAVLAVAPARAAASPGQDMVNAINGVRSAHHLRLLVPSPSLDRSSYGYARYLIESDRFGHAGSIPGGFRLAGEILEHHPGRLAFVQRTVGEWMRSPAHRAIILDPRFRYVGVGLTSGSWLARRTSMWVGRFGS